MIPVVCLLLGLAVGAIAAWLIRDRRIRAAETEVSAERDLRFDLERQMVELTATLEHERRVAAERAELKDEFSNAFRAISAEAMVQLRQQSVGDLDTRQRAMERTLAPLQESMRKIDDGVRELEKARSEAYGSLTTQLSSLAQTQEKLHAETENLVTALRKPAVRGRWGEVQLRRVVEAAGMLPYCDFVEQSTATADGRALRPDLVVRLPGAKQVIVDAKTPLSAYLDAQAESDVDRQRDLLRQHARQVREHVTKLSSKAYWGQFELSPDFVVLFIPGDPFFAAALDQDPALQEDAWRSRVILATPSTLIGLLFVVAYGWRQERLAESARAVSLLGKELYDRLGTLADHVARLGRSLDNAVGSYNETVGSLERRVLVTARRFSELGVQASSEIPSVDPIDHAPRKLQAPELTAGSATRTVAVEPPGESLKTLLPDEPDTEGSDVADAA